MIIAANEYLTALSWLVDINYLIVYLFIVHSVVYLFIVQVFFSSYVFSTNVMVKVATRPAVNPVSYASHFMIHMSFTFHHSLVVHVIHISYRH